MSSRKKKPGKRVWLKAHLDDMLYWRLGELKAKLHCSDWKEFFEYVADFLSKELSPLYIDEKGMLSLILAFAIWKRIEDFSPEDWEMLNDMNILRSFVESGVANILRVLEKMDIKEKIKLAKAIQKKIEILYKMFRVIGEIIDITLQRG